MSTLTLEEWWAKYRPSERMPFLHDVAIFAANPLTVWTEVCCDGVTTIVNGKHMVNREAHYICAIPFIEGEFIKVEES